MGDGLNILGIMSGTSLDGLDLALCQFNIDGGMTNFKLLSFETISYNDKWKERLQNAYLLSAEHYFRLHTLYGEFIADQVQKFLEKNNQSANFIASHGHTVFHQPLNGFTAQIGCGATIAAKTSISTVCDFRSLDVSLKGEGAPLVPIGDRDLFHNYKSCLNIGGIANISFTKNNLTQAFDICVANMALNYLSQSIGKSYDDGGNIASVGNCNQLLLDELIGLKTYKFSLGREWFEQHMLPILNRFTISLQDKLCTCVEYIAVTISKVLNESCLETVLVTGGGAYNVYLMNRLKHHFSGSIFVPSDEIIQFKEAIIFAYLGFLRIRNQENTLASVTKAIRNSIGGCLYVV